MPRSSRLLIAALLLGVTPPRDARAQTGDGRQHSLAAARVAVPPRIDGRGDDAAWTEATPGREFVVFTPSEGGTPTVATEVRVAYDDGSLYVLVRAFDPNPDRILRRLARRDTFDPASDQILLFIDPQLDRRTGYQFAVSPGGVKLDYAIFNDSQTDISWDGVWDVEVSVDSLGWMAEFAIPFRQLRLPPRPDPVFGIIVGRWVGRTGERMSLPQYRRSRAGLSSQMGTLGGLRDLPTGATMEATPYLLARARNVAAAPSRPAEVTVAPAIGGDVKLLPRSGITIDATLNPDFGQVEADPAVLNVTGFEVFQAERRPFFLEGAGLLSFPLTADGRSLLFHSRRIGRRPALASLAPIDASTESTILGAAKVTVRPASTRSVSLLSAVTQREMGTRADGIEQVIEPAAHYGIARIQQDFRGGRSGIGAMLTRVDRSYGDPLVRTRLPRAAQVGALVARHQSANGVYQLEAWGAASELRGDSAAIGLSQLSLVHAFQRPDDGVDFDASRTRLSGRAYSLFAGKVGGTSRFDASFRRLGPGFDVNEAGFLTKGGVQNAAINAGVRVDRTGNLLGVSYRTAALTLGASGEWSANGLAYARRVSLNGLVMSMGLTQLQASMSAELPGAYCGVECLRGGPALVDEPAMTASVDLLGNPRRRLVPHLFTRWTRDDEGRANSWGMRADATWHQRSNLDFSLAAEYWNDRYHAQFYERFGDATSDTAHYAVARLFRPERSLTARVNYTVTNTLSVQWYAQGYLSYSRFSDVREVIDPRARRYEDRFVPYPDTAVTNDPRTTEFRQLRSNLVGRWEYRPGSVLFLVWSHGRDLDAVTTRGIDFGRDARDLLSLRPSNVVALKASYWISRK